MKRLAVAFTGPSNSGKTTLIVKVANILIEKDYRVAIIKNDPKDKAKFDIEGKDSYKFSQTGADVVVTSPTRTTLFSQQSKSLNDIIDMVGDFDFLLVEGLKTLPLPRIAIFRNNLNRDYFDFSNALAVDETINQDEIPTSLRVLNLNNPNKVVEWIMQNAKEV